MSYNLDKDSSKSEIKAELYHQFRKRDINFKLDKFFEIEDERNLIANLTILEEEEPILNIRVKNLSSDVGQTQLWSKSTPTKTIDRYLKTDVPLFVCESYRNIEKTVKFVQHWVNQDMNELYKMYPNKIATINQRRPE